MSALDFPVQRSLRKYFAVAALTLRQRLDERAVLITRALLLWLFVLIFSRLWSAVLPPSGARTHGATEYVWYLAITEWIMLSQPQLYLEIEREVRSGEIVYHASRPISYVGDKLAQTFAELALNLSVLGGAAFVSAYVLGGGLPSDPRGLVLSLPLAMLASVLLALIHTLIGVAAFWLLDCAPVYWIFQKCCFVLGGMLVPLELYPRWLHAVALASPFSALLHGPGSMALGYDPALCWTTALRLGLFLALAYALSPWLARRGLRTLDIHGG